MSPSAETSREFRPLQGIAFFATDPYLLPISLLAWLIANIDDKADDV
ncbi:MAG TPA: hypothetical protein VFW43_03325 [Polaromonas sp.]|nr:hypothetical protein [Polaromonas sp.]